MNESSVVVVGGGLAGLVAARRLAVQGYQVMLFEQRSSLGGRVRSHTVDGFTLDEGFQVLFTSYPAVQRELETEALQLRYFTPGAIIARPHSRSVLADPLRDPRSALASVQNDEVTFTDKLRTLLLRQHVESRSETEIFESPDESIREYLRSWGFSKQYINNFIAPFYGGITLDRTLSTSKRVFEYTFKSLATGRAAIPAAGMGMIAKQLESRARTAGVSIVTNRSVESIHRTNSGVDIETENDTISADAGVIATDPKEATRLSGVTSIPTDARGSVTQYYRLPFDKNPISSTKLLLNAESASPNTIAPLSSVAPEYAPPGESLLSAPFINEGAQHRSPDRLVEETRETLSAWYPDTSWADFEVVETTAVPFAQFAQPPGIHDQLPDVDAPDGPLYLAGDYTTWSAIQGALRSGREAAGAVRRDFPSSV